MVDLRDLLGGGDQRETDRVASRGVALPHGLYERPCVALCRLILGRQSWNCFATSPLCD